MAPHRDGWARYFGNALNLRLMKSFRFLVVALLYVWNIAGCISSAYRQCPEKTFRVAGYVLDAGSRQPVSGVEVKDDGYNHSFNWTRTDSNGRFVLHLPVSRLLAHGQLVGQTALYEAHTDIPADTTQSVTLLLKRNAYRFKPYGCQQLADTARLPPFVMMPILGYPGSQFAFLIRDSSLRQPHKLRTVNITANHSAFPWEPVRLHIYRFTDNPEAPPGESLLQESIVFLPPNETDGMWSYDVSSYGIIVSGTGFYLALEYVVGDYRSSCAPLGGYTPTGPVLRPLCARADIRTWEYAIGQGWHRATAVENCWPLYESALSVEVEPAQANH